MNSFLEHALHERQQLQAQMAAIADRLRVVEALIGTYGEPVQAMAADGVLVPALPPLITRPTVPDAVASILSDGQPRSTAVLLDELARQGIRVGGQRPLINLSSTLSRGDRFINHGAKVGWTLREPEKENPESVGAASGFV